MIHVLPSSNATSLRSVYSNLTDELMNGISIGKSLLQDRMQKFTATPVFCFSDYLQLYPKPKVDLCVLILVKMSLREHLIEKVR